MKDMPREIQLAWFAGLFDGEGNITNGTPSRANDVRIRIILESKDKFVLDLVHEIFGGRMQYVARQKSWKENWSDQWCWCLGRRAELGAFLEEVIPYLVLKKERAEKALAKIRSLQ